MFIRRWLVVGSALLTVAGLAAAEPGRKATADPGGKQSAERRGERSRPRRIHSRDFTTWIYPAPTRGQPWIGYIRVGQSVALRTSTPRPGPGCADGLQVRQMRRQDKKRFHQRESQ